MDLKNNSQNNFIFITQFRTQLLTISQYNIVLNITGGYSHNNLFQNSKIFHFDVKYNK